MELRRLKQNFDSWKKDFGGRIRETKVILNRLGSSNESSPNSVKRKWWTRRNTSKARAGCRGGSVDVVGTAGLELDHREADEEESRDDCQQGEANGDDDGEAKQDVAGQACHGCDCDR
ncbi:hypothetical protein PR202_ga00591 [Eleusine coracana subsp. coracana]|uniref:Uncharacterized protein n=1 Tax=Eleusine coracana subsp. coracana TaxID=191504 RepID=A0AAV5BHT9_ELECO|nr:hypothetical protein PR202_ga00591 [Eleusine coracana subsp. coracana]